jgi:hypothetical protein
MKTSSLKRRSVLVIPVFGLILAAFLLAVPMIAAAAKTRDGWRHVQKWTAHYLARERAQNAQAEMTLNGGGAKDIRLPKSSRTV